MGKEWDELFKAEGIRHDRTTTDSPEQNGIAKRMNKPLESIIVALLNQAGLPKSFWGEALQFATRIINCTPTSKNPDMTPWEAWHGSKPDLSRLRVFGCRAYVWVNKKKRKALESHTEKCIYHGFEDGFKGWRCYNPITKKFVTSHDIVFDETEFPGLLTKETVTPLKYLAPPDDDDDDDEDDNTRPTRQSPGTYAEITAQQAPPPPPPPPGAPAPADTRPPPRPHAAPPTTPPLPRTPETEASRSPVNPNNKWRTTPTPKS